MQPSSFQIDAGYRYLEWMTDRLYHEHRAKLIYGHKPTRRGKAGSNHKFGGIFQNPRLHQLTFGTRSILQDFTRSFREYDSIAWTLSGRTLWGFRALHQTALHEFAHVLQSEIPGARPTGSVHNMHFAKQYLELMRTYPADTYIELWLLATHQPEEIASLARLTVDVKGTWPPTRVGSDPRAHGRGISPYAVSIAHDLAPLDLDRIVDRTD